MMYHQRHNTATATLLAAYRSRCGEAEPCEVQHGGMAPPRTNQLKVSSIGQNLEYFREAAGLTQEKLAEMAGVSRNFIARLELGISKNPEIKNLAAVADALNLSVDDLLADPLANRQVEQLLKKFLVSDEALKIRANAEDVQKLQSLRGVLRRLPATNVAIEHALLAFRSIRSSS